MALKGIDGSSKFEGSAPTYIANILKKAIFTGTLKGGTRLRQEEIANQLGLSPIPVREAFRHLQAEGLVEIVPRHGAVVTRLTPFEVQEIYEIRQFLETGALKLSFPNITDAILEKVRSHLEKMEQTEDDLLWCEMNGYFHDMLYETSNRIMLLSLLKNMRSRVNRYVITYLQSMRFESEREHRRIFDALNNGDLSSAVRELEVHLTNAAKVIIDSRNEETEQVSELLKDLFSGDR